MRRAAVSWILIEGRTRSWVSGTCSILAGRLEHVTKFRVGTVPFVVTVVYCSMQSHHFGYNSVT